MKKFLKSIFIFFVAFAILDVCFGLACNYLHEHAKGGGVAKRLYIAKQSKDDIMMFGSSRMSHHYNPQMIGDTLHMSCFNAGEDGNGIILSYGFLQLMLNRYSPKIIIYDISGFDYEVDDNMKYLNFLKPFYDDPKIKEIIHSVSPTEQVKMLSSFYRYNSLFPRLAGSFIGGGAIYQKGYAPLNQKMDYDVEAKTEEPIIVDSLKLSYLQKFISTCKGHHIPLFFSISPCYKASDSKAFAPVIDLCKKNDVPLFDHYADTTISNHREFFKDRTHMNADGAELYSRKIISAIKSNYYLLRLNNSQLKILYNL